MACITQGGGDPPSLVFCGVLYLVYMGGFSLTSLVQSGAFSLRGHLDGVPTGSRPDLVVNPAHDFLCVLAELQAVT